MADHTSHHALHRSYLYAPGTRPELCRKAWSSRADAVIFDLEDAVPHDAKDEARANVADLVADLGARSVGSLHVRVNQSTAGYDVADLRAATAPGVDGIRLPKAERPDDIQCAAALLDEYEAAAGVEAGSIILYPTIESVLGAANIAEILAASPRVGRVAFGSTDYLRDATVLPPLDEEVATLHVRSMLAMQSRLASVAPPIDSVFVDLNDPAGLRASAEWARSIGFFGKSIIHPAQIDAVHDVFTPSAEAVARARATVDAFDAALRNGSAAVVVDGAFIDEAVVGRARSLLRLSDQLEVSP